MKEICLEDIIADEAIRTYIEKGNELLGVLGYTDHSSAHTRKVGEISANILRSLGRSKRTIELAEIAGYMHDIGNMINRSEHAQTGAIMAFSLLTSIGMNPSEIALVCAAIGNHDEETGVAVSEIAAALMIADKTDVRRSRVRNPYFATFDIHDRVNYAVEEADLRIDADAGSITLELKIDLKICSVMDYFEIFLARMLMCRRAAEFLNTKFSLVVNSSVLL